MFTFVRVAGVPGAAIDMRAVGKGQCDSPVMSVRSVLDMVRRIYCPGASTNESAAEGNTIVQRLAPQWGSATKRTCTILLDNAVQVSHGKIRTAGGYAMKKKGTVKARETRPTKSVKFPASDRLSINHRRGVRVERVHADRQREQVRVFALEVPQVVYPLPNQ